MNDGGPLLFMLFAGAFLAWIVTYSVTSCSARHEGRCIEACQPEHFVEIVNQGRECLCDSKRVRLRKAP